MALAGGGYEVGARHIAGLAAWLVLAAMLALGAAGSARLAPPLYWASGLIGGLALFSAISSFWSGSIELSVTEADRVLVYFGFFVAAFLIAQTEKRRQRFAEGLAIAVVFVAALGLGSRLLPEIVSVAQGPGSGPRLRYPLGYWNANGVVFGIGAALLLWISRRSLLPVLRWAAVAALPALLLALYFTYSRGGVLALLVACGCLLALSHDRLWMFATLACGALGAVPAVLYVQGHTSIADNLDNGAAVDQGVVALLLLLAGMALALALFAGLRRLQRARGPLVGRAVRLSRDPVVLKRVALALAVPALAAAVAVGGRAWDQFSQTDIQFGNDPSQRFTDLAGTGRHDFYRVAIDAFGEDPVGGQGAGTYQFTWQERRSIETDVHDAHSLYLEAFAELGAVGGLLVLGIVGLLLWTGFAAWRDASGGRRELYAALLACCLAFAVSVAIDWLWELAVVGAIFFCASGVLVAARCGQLAERRGAANGRPAQRRFGLAVAGLAVAWITALALIGPLLVDREIKASQAAAADGNLASAVEHADTARSIEPWAASPYLQLALLAELQGEFELAGERIDEAIEREERNWLLYYLKERIERRAGDEEAAAAALAEARRLNPRERCLREGEGACG